MRNIKYFFQFIVIIFLFFLFKILGYKLSSNLSGYIFSILGPLFRSNYIANKNLEKGMPGSSPKERSKLLNKMWINYGKILSDYIYIKHFRNSPNFSKKIVIENQKVLDDLKLKNEPVIFISGHFNNFELMAMHIEKSGIDLAAVYRPLNNQFLNPIMEKIRLNYICKKQIKKGISGTKQLLKYFKNKTSVALMIDQRVSQGIKCKLFNENALTTTIPAQFVKKFKTKIVPIYIERTFENTFKLKIYEPINFSENADIESITSELNKILERMILKNPDQWIWTHNRWK
jgi:Kdo2-lipid IVA lauroyltransferase/acyltransferase